MRIVCVDRPDRRRYNLGMRFAASSPQQPVTAPAATFMAMRRCPAAQTQAVEFAVQDAPSASLAGVSQLAARLALRVENLALVLALLIALVVLLVLLGGAAGL